MAVEARHHQMTLFPSQLVSTRDNFVKTTNLPATTTTFNNVYNNNNNNNQSDVVGLPYVNESAVVPETLLPFYNSIASDYPKLSSVNNKADSGLTYNVPPVATTPNNLNNTAMAATRKRPRDPLFDLDQAFTCYSPVSQKTRYCGPAGGMTSFVDDVVVFQIQQHQSEIDRYIAEHNQRVRVELEEKRKRQSRMLISAIQAGVTRKLKEKDEELQRMGKLNWALQERVKAMYVENQLWRDLAQTNEATANSLRSNLEAVLAHVSEDRLQAGSAQAVAPEADDAESSCGSSGPAEGGGRGACRKCGERESSVLLLPCRHLCLCTVCGSSSVGTCPICDSVMSASVRVNMS